MKSKVLTFICPHFVECYDKPCFWNRPNEPYGVEKRSYWTKGIYHLSKAATKTRVITTQNTVEWQRPLRIVCNREANMTGFWMYLDEKDCQYEVNRHEEIITLIEVDSPPVRSFCGVNVNGWDRHA